MLIIPIVASFSNPYNITTDSLKTCKSHTDCGIGEYCDINGHCFDSLYCTASENDAISGRCPQHQCGASVDPAQNTFLLHLGSNNRIIYSKRVSSAPTHILCGPKSLNAKCVGPDCLLVRSGVFDYQKNTIFCKWKGNCTCSCSYPTADWNSLVYFKHMRKAGGTTVRCTLQSVMTKESRLIENEWWIRWPRHDALQPFSVINFRDPIKRILSSVLFEGLREQCWNGSNNMCLNVSVALEMFPKLVQLSLQYPLTSLLKQVSWPNTFASEGFWRGKRLTIMNNYYVYSLTLGSKHRCGPDKGLIPASPDLKSGFPVEYMQHLDTNGIVLPELSECHVNHAIDNVLNRFDRVVILGETNTPLTMITNLGDTRGSPECLGNFTFDNFNKYSAWGHIHKVGASDKNIDLVIKSQTTKLLDSYPDIIAKLRWINRYDIMFFNRLIKIAYQRQVSPE